MKLLHIPFLLVLLSFTAYIRDVFGLPFYGSRIFIINLYLLMAGGALYFQSYNIASVFKRANPHVVEGVNTRYFLMVFSSVFVFFSINLFLAVYRDEQYYFLIFQLLNFSFGLIYLYLILLNDGINSFLKSFSAALWLLLCFQIVLYVIGHQFNMHGEVTSHRNGLAYIALFFYFLNRAYGSGDNKKYYLLVVMFALLNQVTGVFVLLVFDLLLSLSNRMIFKTISLRSLVGPAAILAIVLASYFSLDFLLFYLDLSLDELNAMEANRYYVPDKLASFISRAVSLPFTLDAVIQGGSVLGLGMEAASKLLYWGYPVHNYFVSIIAITGIVGMVFSLMLLYFFYKVSKLNVMLAISGVFLLSISNDLHLSLVLCFIPVFIRRFHLLQKSKTPILTGM